MKKYRVVTDENGRYEVQIKEWLLLPWAPVCLGSFNTIDTAIEYINKLKLFEKNKKSPNVVYEE